MKDIFEKIFKHRKSKNEIEQIQPNVITFNIASGSCRYKIGDIVNKYAEISYGIFSGIGGKLASVKIGNRHDTVSVIFDSDAGEERLKTATKPITEYTENELRVFLTEKGLSLPSFGSKKPRTVIIDCTDGFGSNLNPALCMSYPNEIILGAKILMKLCSAKSGIIAVSPKDTAAANMLQSKLRVDEDLLKISLTGTSYPYGDSQTVYGVKRLEINAARIPSGRGYPVFSSEFCIAVYNAMLSGIPFCEKHISVNGRVIKVPFGTSVVSLCETDEEKAAVYQRRVIADEVREDDTVSANTYNIVYISVKNEYKAANGNCIKCGRCVSACPAGIMPYLFYVTKGKMSETLKADLNGCFECGNCSAVCPCELPVYENIMQLKGKTPDRFLGEEADRQIHKTMPTREIQMNEEEE